MALKQLPIGEKITYLGYSGRKIGENIFCLVKLGIKGIVITLQGSTEKDGFEINRIRNICYFGYLGGFIFLSEKTIDGKKSLLVTGGYYKLCQAPIISMLSCEWAICAACAQKCDHHYISGLTHSEKTAGEGEYCDICGRAKP